jgi:hypothetical protein
MDLVAGLGGCERPCAGADRLEQEGNFAGRRLAEAHRARQRAAGRLEHEELPGDARIQAASLETKERVGPDRLVGEDAKRFSSAH